MFAVIITHVQYTAVVCAIVLKERVTLEKTCNVITFSVCREDLLEGSITGGKNVMTRITHIAVI